MKTKEEIIKLYLSDLNNIVRQSPARDSRIAMLESELQALEGGQELCPTCHGDKIVEGHNYPRECPTCKPNKVVQRPHKD